MKYLNKNFKPYQLYFNNNSALTLVKNKPPFYIHSYFYDKIRLSNDRMAMYYRGTVD